METLYHKAESIKSNGSLDSKNKRSLYLTSCSTTQGLVLSLKKFHSIVALILLYCMNILRKRDCDMFRIATGLVKTPG